MTKLTPVRLAALRRVADGELEFSTSMGTWEPKFGYRISAYDWLAERGLIRERLGAEPVGRVTQRIPVDVTDAGREALNATKEQRP